jgi:hypothetical protein
MAWGEQRKAAHPSFGFARPKNDLEVEKSLQTG